MDLGSWEFEDDEVRIDGWSRNLEIRFDRRSLGWISIEEEAELVIDEG